MEIIGDPDKGGRGARRSHRGHLHGLSVYELRGCC
jgi:hypothetical protein